MRILKETTELPLKIRRIEQNVKTALKIASNPSKLSFNNTVSNRKNMIFKSHPKLPKPFYNRISLYQKELGIEVAGVIPRRFERYPPWKMEPIKTNDNLYKYIKEDTPEIIYKSLFKEIAEKYQIYIHIYTDGSKSNQETGYATVLQTEKKLIRLPDEASIFASELIAIQQAMNIITKHEGDKFIIFSDSRSAITAITNNCSNNHIILEIQEKLPQSQVF